MKRGLLILILGLIGGAAAYCCVYLLGTATPRALMQSAQPELAWLKHEFNLSQAEFDRISQLHAGYLPQCRERCRRINELNQQLQALLSQAKDMTSEIEGLLNERAQVRALCQSEMLSHFFEVSRSMPAEQGRRYLDWVSAKTCLQEQPMQHELADAKAGATHHH